MLKTLARARRILRSPLPGDLKRAVLRTHFALAAAREGTGRLTRNVAGYRVTAHDLPTLRFLFDETFVELQYYFRARTATPLVIDCGSNLGMSVLFFKRLYPGARIIAFEPEPSAFRLLEENLAANRIQGVEVHAAALGAEAGEATLYLDTGQPGSPLASTVPGRIPAGTARVPQVRLSDYVREAVDLLKLDVEGAERAVVEELVTSGAAERVRRMIIEYHHHIDPGEDALGDFLNLLVRGGFGYQVAAFYDASRREPAEPGFQDVQIYAYRRAGSPSRGS